MRDVARDFYECILAGADSVASSCRNTLRGDFGLLTEQEREKVAALTAAGLSDAQVDAICMLVRRAARMGVSTVLGEIDQRSAMADSPDDTVCLVDVDGARLSNDLHSEFADFRLHLGRTAL